MKTALKIFGEREKLTKLFFLLLLTFVGILLWRQPHQSPPKFAIPANRTESVLELVRLLSDSDSHTRFEAAAALAAFGTDAKEATPALLSLLQDSDPSVSTACASTLCSIAPGDRSVLRSLIEAFQCDGRPGRASFSLIATPAWQISTVTWPNHLQNAKKH
jgi:hypothetical protein